MTRATLNDLLERVLDKGLILDADIMIVLAGIPLIGVKLRAAIAGMATMERYGLMVDWDRKIREEKNETQSLPPVNVITRRIPRDSGNR
jgi:hypothetical protein